jgi:hypothetical protein
VDDVLLREKNSCRALFGLVGCTSFVGQCPVLDNYGGEE